MPSSRAVFPSTDVRRQNDARRHRRARDPGQPLRAAAARQQAEPRLGQAELGLVGGNAQIAAERQLVAAAHGRAADLGEAHLRQIGDALEQLLERPRDLRRRIHLVGRRKARARSRRGPRRPRTP